MPPILKSNYVHAIVANAPRIISVDATATPPGSRTFYGTGAPSSTTLATGNGKYNAAQSGFIVNATLAAGGTGYVVGDTLTVSGGTSTAALQLVIDQVDGSGVIIDFHVSQTGAYSAYPTAAGATTTGGTGTGATFNLNFPALDYYLDVTTPTVPVLYVCMTSGSKSTSVWAKVSGGSGGGTFADFYDTTGGTAYSTGAVVQVLTTSTVGGVTIQPGTYILRNGLSAPSSPTGNQVPQYPYPSGTIYWICIAFGPTEAGICGTGAGSIYVNATGTF